MTAILIKTAQLLLSLFIITAAHELGHYLWARLWGIKVEKLQIFAFSIFNWTGKNTGTKYGIGWLPLGGYCVMPDIQNENKPFKKILVFSGGVINNVVLAFVIFMCLAWFWTPSAVDHVQVATERGMHMFTNSVQSYSHAVKTSSPSDAGGLLSLGNVFSGTWQGFRFWYVTAYCSIAMEVFNIIPIPGLDGGQITFASIEAILRRPINENVKICTNLLGVLFVLAFIIYGNYNDICRLFTK